jgi:hypothetical protein
MLPRLKALGSLKHFGSTVLDVASDAVLLTSLLPSLPGWLIMAAMLASEVLAAVLIHRCVLLAHHKGTARATTAGSVDKASHSCRHCMACGAGWTQLLHQMYAVIAACKGRLFYVLVMLAMSVALMPAMSLTVHVLTLTMALSMAATVFAGDLWPARSWVFMDCLNIQRCAEVRSTAIALVEAPAVIGFNTWAYLAPFKSVAKVYISGRAFYFSLLTSMLHILLELWELQKAAVQAKSLSAGFRSRFSLGLAPLSNKASDGAGQDGAAVGKAAGQV